MMFSVVIPMYDKAAYVEEAIGSVLGQSEQDFEVIVVDDGSRDDGAARVERIVDERVRCERQANAGVSVARNRGVELARGEWVVFFDADDAMHPQMLAAVRAAIEAHPLSDFVAVGYREVPNGRWTHTMREWALPEHAALEIVHDLADRWLRGPLFSTSTIAVRRELLLALSPCFAPGEANGEDLDFFFRAAERTPIVFDKRPFVSYRTSSSGSLSSRSLAVLEPPYLVRLERRAPTYTADRRASTLRFVREIRVSLARERLAAGRRGATFRLLWRGRAAARSYRWWLTLGMASLLPTGVAEKIVKRRLARGRGTFTAGGSATA